MKPSPQNSALSQADKEQILTTNLINLFENFGDSTFSANEVSDYTQRRISIGHLIFKTAPQNDMLLEPNEERISAASVIISIGKSTHSVNHISVCTQRRHHNGYLITRLSSQIYMLAEGSEEQKYPRPVKLFGLESLTKAERLTAGLQHFNTAELKSTNAETQNDLMIMARSQHPSIKTSTFKTATSSNGNLISPHRNRNHFQNSVGHIPITTA